MSQRPLTPGPRQLYHSDSPHLAEVIRKAVNAASMVLDNTFSMGEHGGLPPKFGPALERGIKTLLQQAGLVLTDDHFGVPPAKSGLPDANWVIRDAAGRYLDPLDRFRPLPLSGAEPGTVEIFSNWSAAVQTCIKLLQVHAELQLHIEQAPSALKK